MTYRNRRYEPSEEARRITDLRKGGQLKDAYNLARSYFSQGNREETFMQAYIWVLYDCLKRYYETNTKFYGDIRAYCSVLAQIRKFPTNPSRDEMFIENLEKHVLKVGWALRKNNKINDLQILCSEICLWRPRSPLYTEDIARMLIVGLKPYDQSFVVMRWLGVSDAPWSAIVSGQTQVRVSSEIAGNALAWAFYDDLKSCAGDDQGNGMNFRSFIDTLSAIRVIIPGVFDAHEAAPYAAGKFASIGWKLRERKNFGQIEEMLNEAVHWGRGAALHRQEVLTMFFVSLQERPADVLRLVEWYGLSNLDHDAFQPREYEGKQMPSRAQDLVKAYLDALMSNDASGNPIASSEMKNAGCEQTISLLNDPRCSHWVWEPYKLGKLLCEVGRYPEARERLAPIVAKSQTESWAWRAYAKTWEVEAPDNYEKCLFMGLSVSNDDQFSRSLHEDAAELLARTGRFPEAKAEILLLDKQSEENGWRASECADILKREDWFAKTDAVDSNETLYSSLSQGAIELVAEELPWTQFYVDKVIAAQHLAHIVVDDPSRDSYFRAAVKRDDIASCVSNGLCYRGRFGSEYKSIIGAIEPFAGATMAKHFTSTYSGQIDLVQNFGFVNSSQIRVWVPPALLDGQQAKQFQQASGSCRKTYKPPKSSLAKGTWEWEATTLELGAEADEDSYRLEGAGRFQFARSRYDKKDFGFVEDENTGDEYYVPAKLIDLHHLTDCKTINFIAKKSWDRKKNRWGWKVTEIID